MRTSSTNPGEAPSGWMGLVVLFGPRRRRSGRRGAWLEAARLRLFCSHRPSNPSDRRQQRRQTHPPPLPRPLPPPLPCPSPAPPPSPQIQGAGVRKTQNNKSLAARFKGKQCPGRGLGRFNGGGSTAQRPLALIIRAFGGTSAALRHCLLHTGAGSSNSKSSSSSSSSDSSSSTTLPTARSRQRAQRDSVHSTAARQSSVRTGRRRCT
jgi:hypothetical protein